MGYNWDGDYIIQDCKVSAKRFVLGSRKPITTDIREFISPADDAVLKEVVAELVRSAGLPCGKEEGSFDRRAWIVWDFVAKQIRYRPDAKGRHGDFWLFPCEVRTLKYGDCEDGTFLLASLLLASGISPFNVRIVLGELKDGAGNSLGGHCWPIYKNEDGRWCILESSFERAGWSLPTVDRFEGDRMVRFVPHFCFNNFHLWGICHEEGCSVGIDAYVKERTLANLIDPVFPSGGWISALTGDNSPGHLEITREVLRAAGFSKDAVALTADAAQDPDFYEWNNPAAHAQTPNDDAGRTNVSVEAAIASYTDWASNLIDRIKHRRSRINSFSFSDTSCTAYRISPPTAELPTRSIRTSRM